MLPVRRPTRIQRSVPAAAAITATSYIAEQPTVVSSTSSSEIIPVASTSTREPRPAAALAKRAIAQSKYTLDKANHEVTRAQEHASNRSPTSSIAGPGDVQSDGVSSARAPRPISLAEMAVPPLPMNRVASASIQRKCSTGNIAGKLRLACGNGKRGSRVHLPALTERMYGEPVRVRRIELVAGRQHRCGLRQTAR